MVLRCAGLTHFVWYSISYLLRYSVLQGERFILWLFENIGVAGSQSHQSNDLSCFVYKRGCMCRYTCRRMRRMAWGARCWYDLVQESTIYSIEPEREKTQSNLFNCRA
ncbi:hypothetical protein PILCRDRAFT_272359 [Piloderma croceum F 1598]|uniref:Uncharacterized protein n=1 Tax=Piloderma croceum (strain F 1598) TaxID=765440 RepID=A0A0C3G9M8_PILCF|nr:hypothetical protein PILCRDRAFT_272359 [Piloderma croceum F 1598]